LLGPKIDNLVNPATLLLTSHSIPLRGVTVNRELFTDGEWWLSRKIIGTKVH
jgi:hypothetical protein